MVTASIVIPTYNRAEFLPRAIDSILNQTFRGFEVIVVDDGSTDETEAVVSEYPNEEVTYLAHEKNCGPSAARNTGIESSTGEFVAFLDSDDELKPSFLETSVRTIREELSDCAGTFVALQVHRDGEVVDTHGVAPVVSSAQELERAEGRMGGLMLRSSVFDDIGLFDEDLAYMDDVAYWIRLLQEYYLVGIEEPLYKYYWHGDTLTNDDEAIIEGLPKFLESHEEILPPTYWAKYRCQLGKAYLRQGEFREAIEEFHKGVKTDPRQIFDLTYYLSRRTVSRLLHALPGVK